MFPYENLEVYKKAFELNRTIYSILKKKNNLPSYIKSQLGRASLSIVLNIAEGSGKFKNKDRANFLTMARGSTFECASIIQFLAAENELAQEEAIVLSQGFDEISRILYTMIKNLNFNPIQKP